jgi:hypothetical protein
LSACDAKPIVTASEIGDLLSGSRTGFVIDTPVFAGRDVFALQLVSRIGRLLLFSPAP